jgi:hypothetical protein
VNLVDVLSREGNTDFFHRDDQAIDSFFDNQIHYRHKIIVCSVNGHKLLSTL